MKPCMPFQWTINSIAPTKLMADETLHALSVDGTAPMKPRAGEIVHALSVDNVQYRSNQKKGLLKKCVSLQWTINTKALTKLMANETLYALSIDNGQGLIKP